MEIKVVYRPFTGSINAWNTIDDSLSEHHRLMIEEVFRYPQGDDWYIRYTQYDKGFHNLQVIDCHTIGHGAGWNIFLAQYVGQEVIDVICGMIARCDAMIEHPALNHQSLEEQRILKRFSGQFVVDVLP
jgi:hypothetical protein